MIGRGLIVAAGIAFLAGAAAAWRAGTPGPVVILLCGLGTALTIGGVFEKAGTRYLKKRPGPDWIETSERFVDEKSGKLVTVFYKPDTGERTYVQGK